MVKKQKIKKKPIENEFYEIEIEDWEVYYDFGLNQTHKGLTADVYWEYCNLILTGKILLPILKQADKAKFKYQLIRRWMTIGHQSRQ